MLGPVERQIEFGQPRRGELDGLAALQDRFDQLRAQEGEVGKMEFLVSELGEAVSVMRTIKRALDPANILNPGKIVHI